MSRNPLFGGLDLPIMATLTQTVATTRKLALWAILFGAGLIIFLVIFNYSKSIYTKLFPPKPTNISAFGKLPYLEIEKNPNVTSSEGSLFVIETANNKLPNLGNYANVYPIAEPAINLWTLEDTKTKAKTLGFPKEPETLDAFNFKWTQSSPISKTLLFNSKENSYSLNTNFIDDPEIISKQKIIEDKTAIDKARNFLKILGFEQKELEKTKITRLTIKDGKLEEVPSKSETYLIRVSFQRADIEKNPVISLDEKTTEVSVLLNSYGTEIQKQVVGASVVFWNPDLTKGSPYPIKTSSTAFEELKSGKAQVLSKPYPEIQKIKIQHIYLAYFNPPNLQKYLQPIIVFDGENGFRAVVEAVSANSKQK